jgi:predicted Zn-dependent protease
MAHEMAHVRLHHLYRMIEHQKNMQIPKLASMLAAIALGVVNPILGSGALMGTLSGFEQDSINYVRSNEKEADSIGIDILSRASFDPNGMPNFFRKMQQNTRYYYTDNIPAILRTHPLDEDRIAEADSRIAQLHHIPLNHSSNDYYLFKELIRHDVPHDSRELMNYYKNECRKYSPTFACIYGEALSQIELNQSAKAIDILEPLLKNEFQDNSFLNLALAEAYENQKKNKEADAIYQKFYTVSPNNRAVVDQYSNYLKTDDPKKALSVLLKGHRKFPSDINICLKLARTQASLHLTAEAYFTEATCHIIQGNRHLAIEQLKTAQKYAKNNNYMLERISAKLDELKDKP